MALVAGFLAFASGSPILGHAAAREESHSPRTFVGDFYSWYVPAARDAPGGAPLDRVLASRRSAFGHRLLKALRGEAEHRGSGLGFDPFLGEGEVPDAGAVGRVVRKGVSHLVEVHAVRGGRRQDPARVVAEVRSAGGRWFFVNFHYPPRRNLLRLLEARRKPSPAVARWNFLLGSLHLEPREEPWAASTSDAWWWGGWRSGWS